MGHRRWKPRVHAVHIRHLMSLPSDFSVAWKLVKHYMLMHLHVWEDEIMLCGICGSEKERYRHQTRKVSGTKSEANDILRMTHFVLIKTETQVYKIIKFGRTSRRPDPICASGMFAKCPLFIIDGQQKTNMLSLS